MNIFFYRAATAARLENSIMFEISAGTATYEFDCFLMGGEL